MKAVFDAALEFDRAERAAFVVSACGDEVDLALTGILDYRPRPRSVRARE